MSTGTHVHGQIGESIKRVEDARFLRGKGNYMAVSYTHLTLPTNREV